MKPTPLPPHVQNALAQITGETTPGMRRLLKAGWTTQQLAMAMREHGCPISSMHLGRVLRRKDLQTMERRDAIKAITGVTI